MNINDGLDLMKWLLVFGNLLLFATSLILFYQFKICKKVPSDDASTHTKEKCIKRVMLIIAHPDDESMFFLPLLNSLQNSKKTEIDIWKIYLLCLSRGNADGLGNIREKELFKCSDYIGIPTKNVQILEDPKLQDGMKVVWDSQHIKRVVISKLQSNCIDVVFTFDQYGVSNHANHIAVYNGVKEALLASELKQNVVGWALETTNIVRKYIGVFDIFFSVISGHMSVFCCKPWWNYTVMAVHHSQFVWYRRLFVLFSRYTYVNTFYRMTPEKIKEN